MEPVIEAINSKASWQEKLDAFNTENANATTFVDRYGADVKLRFVEGLITVLQSHSNQGVDVNKQTLIAVLTAIKICLREPAGINTVFDSQERLDVMLNYAGITSPASSGQHVQWDIRAEASKCLVNLVAKNKTAEQTVVQKFDGANKIVGLLQHEEIPQANLFPLLRILLHLSLAQTVAQAIRHTGLKAVVHILNRSYPVDESNKDAALPFNDSDTTPLEALKVVFNLTLALGPLASGRASEPALEDVSLFHQLQSIYVRILSAPLPPARASFTPVHTYILQLKICVVNCLLNTPKGQFKSAFGTNQTPASYLQPLSASDSEKTVLGLLGILSLQAQSSSETPSEALAPILMMLTTLAQEVPEVREFMKLYIFPKEILDQLPESVGVEMPASVQQSPIASRLVPLMSSLEPALKHYVNEFFYFVSSKLCDSTSCLLLKKICDEDANEVCHLTGFGNAAGLLVMRGLMNVPGS